MDDSTKEELRVLRDRAYGPDADIDQDPAALDRLRQLEQIGRRSEIPDVPTPAAPPDDSAPEDVEPDDPATGDDALHTPPTVRRWSRRRLTAAWIGSVVGAAVLGAGATALSSDLFADTERGTPVGTLREVAELVWPEFLGTATSDARGYTDFFGMTAITTDREWSGPGTDTCMLILESAKVTAAANEGSLQYSCGTTAFPASVQFAVTAEMPPELVERFPVGTDLQFVLAKSSPDALDALQVNVFTRTEQAR